MIPVSDLYSFWLAVWPNLAADVVWVPLVGIYHLWTRRHLNALHTVLHELRANLDGQKRPEDHSMEPVIDTLSTTTVNWGKVFKSPQAVISLLVAAVTTAGTAGLINTSLSGAVQSLLVAVLGVIAAVTHVSVSAKVAQRQARKALDEGESA